MTKKEALQILAILKAAYPSSYNGMTKEEATGTVAVWCMQFADNCNSKITDFLDDFAIGIMDTKMTHNYLEEEVKNYNISHPENFQMGIACGCVRYDSLLDYGLEDTLRRADKVMYYQKFWMKNNANPQIQNNP